MQREIEEEVKKGVVAPLPEQVSDVRVRRRRRGVSQEMMSTGVEYE